MAREAKKVADAEPAAAEHFEVSPEVLRMAEGCFARADDSAKRSNYGYALTLYLEGLRYTPDNVERGHKPLYETAMRQKMAGKSGGWGAKTARMKANMLEMTGKKKEAFLELEKAMCGAPDNHADLAALAQKAHNLGLKKTAVFFADRTIELSQRDGKLVDTICTQMADIYESNGRFHQAMQCLQQAENLDKTGSARHMKRIRDLAARTTIDKTDTESDFRANVANKDQAQDSARQKVVTAEDELVQKAEELVKSLEQTPNDLNLMITIGDTYARAGRDQEAMKFYRKARAASGGGDYRIKVKMDDLKIREFRQKLREVDEKLRSDADNPDLKSQRKELLDRRNQFELEVFKERVDEYPTDMSMRYELGVRYYRTDMINEAIAAFQMATRDPKRKIDALNMLGKCFFQRNLSPEAAAQFRAAIEIHELQGDALWKELRYNLALTYEKMKKLEEAASCYSEIIMTDIQYRDAADRLSKIRQQMEE